MRGRLLVATNYARSLGGIADRLEATMDDYVSGLETVSDGSLTLIDRMEQDPGDLEEGREFGMATRQMAAIARDSTASLAGMVDSINENAQLSRVLREPSRRLTEALERFADGTSNIDEWDRRLQSLGIPVPPEGWEPDFSEPDTSEEHSTADQPTDDPGPRAGESDESGTGQTDRT